MRMNRDFVSLWRVLLLQGSASCCWSRLDIWMAQDHFANSFGSVSKAVGVQGCGVGGE